MEYYRHGRTLVPAGSIFDNVDDALNFAKEFEMEPLTEKLNSVRFAVDENGYLNVQIGDAAYYLTYSALKDLCSLLKMPISFINKFPPSRLMLETLNKNPYLTDDSQTVTFLIWKWEEKLVIAGILQHDIVSIPVAGYLEIMKEYDAFSRESTQLDAIVINGDEVVTYFILPNEVAREGFSFYGGFAIHYSPVRATDTNVYPFYRMSVTSRNGELFDFDFESPKKLRVAKRKKKDYQQLTMEFATQYEGEDLGVDFENTLKRGIASRQLSSVKFAISKLLKSRATSAYSYNGVKVESSTVAQEIIPEFKQFVAAHQDMIKQREPYEVNTMQMDFYLPLYFNRMFTFQSSSENPYFFVKYRQTIGKVMNKILEEVGDIVLTPDN